MLLLVFVRFFLFLLFILVFTWFWKVFGGSERMPNKTYHVPCRWGPHPAVAFSYFYIQDLNFTISSWDTVPDKWEMGTSTCKPKFGYDQAKVVCASTQTKIPSFGLPRLRGAPFPVGKWCHWILVVNKIIQRRTSLKNCKYPGGRTSSKLHTPSSVKFRHDWRNLWCWIKFDDFGKTLYEQLVSRAASAEQAFDCSTVATGTLCHSCQQNLRFVTCFLTQWDRVLCRFSLGVWPVVTHCDPGHKAPVPLLPSKSAMCDVLCDPVRPCLFRFSVGLWPVVTRCDALWPGSQGPCDTPAIKICDLWLSVTFNLYNTKLKVLSHTKMSHGEHSQTPAPEH